MIELNIITAFLIYLGIWLILYVISKYFKTQKKGLIVGPFYAMYKTRVFNRLLKNLGRHRRFWNIIWNIAIALSFGQIIFIMLSLSRNMLNLAERAEGMYQLIPLLPGITISWDSLPYFLLTLAILIISHEAAHGIASVVERVPIKSSGVLLALILPGAFVELDENKLKKIKPISQLRIFSAGSTANLTLGLLFLGLMISLPYIISPLYESESQGILVSKIVDGSGADEGGLQQWTTITQIDGIPIHNISDLQSFMKTVKPNATLLFHTDEGMISITIKPHPINRSQGVIGINIFEYYPPRFSWTPKQLPYHLYITAYWMNTILISVALINMLPLYPLDGGRVVTSLLHMFKIQNVEKIKIIISIISLGILVANLLLSISRFGFGKI